MRLSTRQRFEWAEPLYMAKSLKRLCSLGIMGFWAFTVLTAVLAGLMDMGIEGLKARVRLVLVNPGFPG